MEEDIHDFSTSRSKSSIKIEERLKEAMDKASDKLKYETAHDDELIHALSVVADFIKRKRRVCYGGTAMNAILPDSKKFYDPRVDLPDYDFYTPDVEGDVKELVEQLNTEGFKEVYHKVGIHEGTKKIMVNFTPIADISLIEPDLYAILLRRSILKEGMHYTDENVLRMMMYLELSRPKGMVDRWPKVFERLQLINSLFPIRGCTKIARQRGKIPLSARRAILDYVVEWHRILCNGSLIPLYTQGIRKKNAKFQIQDGGAVLFTSPDPKVDSIALKKILGDDVKLLRHSARGEIVPERIEIQQDGKTLCMVVQEIACHSYNTLPLPDGRKIFIGSPEFLITLYLSLAIFTTNVDNLLGSNVLCQVSQLIRLARENYSAKGSQFPPFSGDCRGHQTRFASLLREKVKRIQREKDMASTRRRSPSKRSATRKAR